MHLISPFPSIHFGIKKFMKKKKKSEESWIPYYHKCQIMMNSKRKKANES